MATTAAYLSDSKSILFYSRSLVFPRTKLCEVTMALVGVIVAVVMVGLVFCCCAPPVPEIDTDEN